MNAAPWHGIPSEARGRADRNGFVTALGVRAVRRRHDAVPGPWLDVLEECRAGPYGFAFWADARRPAWAPVLPADSDDTAVMTLELLLAGRLGERDARRIACRGIAAHRNAGRGHPPWLRPGSFATWHRDPRAPGAVTDCAALANALALLAVLGLEELPGAAESVATIVDGVAWAGDDRRRLAALTPFYPEPAELAEAVAHAVDCGAHGLDGTARALAGFRHGSPDAVVCSSAYGAVTWRSPQLAAVRAGDDPATVLAQTRAGAACGSDALSRATVAS